MLAKVEGSMPGIGLMASGVNVFNGDSFGSRPERSVWEFTTTKGRKMNGEFRYDVPD